VSTGTTAIAIYHHLLYPDISYSFHLPSPTLKGLPFTYRAACRSTCFFLDFWQLQYDNRHGRLSS
jgi:hypothetical protein